MKKSKFNMSAGTVTLDLNATAQVLGSAVFAAKERLYSDMTEIQSEFENAHRALAAGDKDGYFRGMCHANTHREYMLRNANQYAEAIEAYFHVCQAIEREETKIEKVQS